MDASRSSASASAPAVPGHKPITLNQLSATGTNACLRLRDPRDLPERLELGSELFKELVAMRKRRDQPGNAPTIKDAGSQTLSMEQRRKLQLLEGKVKQLLRDDPSPADMGTRLSEDIWPTAYAERLGIFQQNLAATPFWLAIYIDRREWHACKRILMGHFVPSFLQLQGNPMWKHCGIATAPLANEWTTLWHVLESKLLMASLCGLESDFGSEYKSEVPHCGAMEFIEELDRTLCRLTVICEENLQNGTRLVDAFMKQLGLSQSGEDDADQEPELVSEQVVGGSVLGKRKRDDSDDEESSQESDPEIPAAEEPPQPPPTLASPDNSANVDATAVVPAIPSGPATPAPVAPTPPAPPQSANPKTREAWEKGVRIETQGWAQGKVVTLVGGDRCRKCQLGASPCYYNRDIDSGNTCSACARRKEKCSRKDTAEGRIIRQTGVPSPAGPCVQCVDRVARGEAAECYQAGLEDQGRKGFGTACSQCCIEGTRQSCSINQRPKMRNGKARD